MPNIHVMSFLATTRQEGSVGRPRDRLYCALQMSRLDSFIRRLTAQRACLDEAVRLTANLPGNVLELGLGNGRTYDHLRCALRGRDIYVFDRRVAAHPDCIPSPDRLFLGDFLETLPSAARLLGTDTALVHA